MPQPAQIEHTNRRHSLPYHPPLLHRRKPVVLLHTFAIELGRLAVALHPTLDSHRSFFLEWQS